jgi:hypothetical protein
VKVPGGQEVAPDATARPGVAEEATMVRLPEAAGQVRNAPVKALRGFFAGIGQLLLAADRFRAEEAERERAGDDEQHDPLTTQDRQPAGEQRRFRSLDSTGNVRVLTQSEAAGPSPDADARPDADASAPADVLPHSDVPPSDGSPVAFQPAAAASSAPAAATAPGTRPAPAGLPVPGYDGLSLPSLRSRLRVLDAAQLRVLVEYEKSNAKRADVVTMFERRIARLEAARPDAT